MPKNRLVDHIRRRLCASVPSIGKSAFADEEKSNGEKKGKNKSGDAASTLADLHSQFACVALSSFSPFSVPFVHRIDFTGALVCHPLCLSVCDPLHPFLAISHEDYQTLFY